MIFVFRVVVCSALMGRVLFIRAGSSTFSIFTSTARMAAIAFHFMRAAGLAREEIAATTLLSVSSRVAQVLVVVGSVVGSGSPGLKI